MYYNNFSNLYLFTGGFASCEKLYYLHLFIVFTIKFFIKII